METIILHNTQVENQVISALLLDAGIFDTLWDSITLDLFVDADARMTVDIIKQMVSVGKRAEFSEVGMQLAAKGIDVTKYMTTEVISYEVTRQRIELLKDLAYKRKVNILLLNGLQMLSDPTSEKADFDKLIDDLQKQGEGDAVSNILTFGETLKQLQNDVAKRMNEEANYGLRTGLNIFDSRYGFHTGDLVIVAGATSQGKSTMATTIARNMALQSIPVAYYSLEMGAKQLTARITARDTMIASSRLLYSKMNDMEYAQFYDRSLSMMNLPIYFDERSKTSFNKICTSVRKLVHRHGVKVVFIDYLQILANGNNDNREQLLGDMARDLKRLAVEEDICVVCLSQLARSKDKPAPDMNRLRGSGQIEEAADMVVTIYRPYLYDIMRYDDGRTTEGTAQVEIKKGRNIGLGKEVVTFNGELTFFCDCIGAESTQVKQKDKFPW